VGLPMLFTWLVLWQIRDAHHQDPHAELATFWIEIGMMIIYPAIAARLIGRRSE
jgi:hypothetical protein